MPYDGMTVNTPFWLDEYDGMGYEFVPHIIQNNEIHNVMQVLHDGAALITHGQQTGTIISNNYFHDIVRTKFHMDQSLFPWGEKYTRRIAGVYLDDYSKGFRTNNRKK